MIYDCEQGSAKWYEVRRGKPTASNFHKIVTPGGKLSEQRHKYMDRLIAETLLNESMDDAYQSEWMQRGQAYEPLAAAQFSFLENCDLQAVGFVTDDDDRLGCSPDRLIKGKAECVEIKCPRPDTQIGRLLRGLDTDYKPQVQGQILVGRYERVHFYSWEPRMPPFKLITLPDKAFLKIMRQHLADFLDELDANLSRARDMGVYQPNVTYVSPQDRYAPAREPNAVNIIPTE